MAPEVEEIRHILTREVTVHRELLALARAKHCLLRQGRWEDAMRLSSVEASHIMTIRALEARRSRMMATSPEIVTHLSWAKRRIAMLLRNLGAVERANLGLWTRCLWQRLSLN